MASLDDLKIPQFLEEGDLRCKDLPSEFRPDIGKVLVTGASGYIGGRLVPELLARGYKVRAMVRAISPEYEVIWPGAEIVVADALNISKLKIALKDIDTAYYLIHSLHLGPEKFARADKLAATNFRKAAEVMNVKRIIYLGGLGDVRNPLSEHLRSRSEVAKELKKGRSLVTILRAAVIVGSGSASYEIMRNLIKNAPFILIPKWGINRCQPISIRDVIKYLVGVLELKEAEGRSFDIGGEDILNYEQMLKELETFLGKKLGYVHVPISSINFFSYLTSLFTPVPVEMAHCLIEGLKNEVICQDDAIRKLLPFRTISYKEAIVRAMTREEQDRVHTSWTDAYPLAHELAIKLREMDNNPGYEVHYSLFTNKSAASLFKSICGVGGKRGWFHSDWMWQIRGLVDRILLGVGSMRGRRSNSSLNVNDVIDFWRIEDVQEDKRLLLRAEMKLPGKAWLEFNIEDENNERKLMVTAYFYTRSILGKIYWYTFSPFHSFIFHNLIKEIERHS